MALVADDRTATVCEVLDPVKDNPQLLFDDERKPPPPRCIAVDLATGAWREAKAPPAPSTPRAFEVQEADKGVRSGGELEILDARTGSAHRITAHWILPPVRAPSGKLVGLSAELLAGMSGQPAGVKQPVIAVIDPAAGRIEKQHAVPICPRRPPPASAAAAVTVTPLPPTLVLSGARALALDSDKLFAFELGGDGAGGTATELGVNMAGLIAGSGGATYATAFETGCAQARGEPMLWKQIAGDEPGAIAPLGKWTLVAADAGGTLWATSHEALYKITKQGRHATRLADVSEYSAVVRSEPARLLVVEPGTRWIGGTAGSLAVKEEVKERRLIAIDKATGAATELLRGSLGYVRAMGNELWILRGGTELLSIGEGADVAAPRGDLPEAATSVEIDGGTVYFTPAAGDRVLAVPMAGGASTLVAGGLAAAEILGASGDRLLLSAADLAAQRLVDKNLAAMASVPGPSDLAWAPPRRLLGIPKAGGTARTLADGLQSVRTHASDGGHLYVQVAKCHESNSACGSWIDDPTILVVDQRTSRVRRMSYAGSCQRGFVVGGGGVWLSTGERLDRRDTPAALLGSGDPSAAVAAGDEIFLALDRRLVRASSSGYEIMADVAADGLAIGGGYLYFHDAEATRIGRIALQTGKLETVVASAPSVGAMTADAGGVYWWAAATRSLEAARAPGDRRTLLPNAPRPGGLASGGGRVALLAGERLIVVSAADGASRTLSLGGAGSGVAGDGTHVYWTEADPATGAPVLARAPWSGGERQVLARVAR